jgi:hypothetical protein
MALTISCKCGKKYRAKEEQAGKRFTCKACGAKMIIRAPGDAAPMEEVVSATAVASEATVLEAMPQAQIATTQRNPNKRSSKVTLYVTLAAVLTPILLCTGSCGGCYYVAASFMSGMVADSVKETLAADPTVQQHVGTIESCEISTFAFWQSSKSRRYVFHLTGSKGDGEATVIVPEQETSTKHIVCYPQTLRTSDGKTYDLTVNNSGGFWNFIQKSSKNN